MKAATQTQPNKTANVPNSTSKVSSEDKKKMKEKKAQEKVSQTIKEKEAQAAKELAARYAKVRFDYKDPKQLSEGEIMIVIEHSDDPGRVLMSTSHDYEKYKRIASKIRTWIMRDFPSMKVIMKPNNHKADNMRIGCFEISYFHMKDGQINRQDIFSKMVERKWPKWKQVQGKIKNFVKNSNLVVKLKDISPEKKNQFEGMMIHVKNVLFAHKGKGATTSMTASQLSHEKPELKLSPFKVFESDKSGVIKFDHLPVGNYAIVFEGNRTYKTCEMPFSVSGNDPDIEHTFEIDVVDEGFFCLQVDFEEISEEKASVREKMGEEKDKNKREQYNKTLISLDQFESKINLFKINLVPHNPNRAEDDVCIPLTTEKSVLPSAINTIYECVIEPGKYDIILIDGSQQTVLQKGVSLTRGENRIVYDPQTKKLGDKTRAQIANEKSQKEENKGVSGTGKNNGVEGKTTGEDRPESNMTTMTDQRIPSAKPRIQSGYAINYKPQEVIEEKYVQGTNEQQAEAENEEDEEDEEEEDCMRILMACEDEHELPFKLNVITRDNDLVELVNEDNGPSDEETYFNSDITAVEFGMRRISERNGFVRLFLTKDSSIGQFSPVRISVNLNGVSQIIEINEDVFAGNEHHIFDFAFIKVPENKVVEIGILSEDMITSPEFKLGEIKTLISKTTNSKLGLDKIFGFNAKPEERGGHLCKPVKEVKKSLDNFEFTVSNYILNAFKPKHSEGYISFQVLKNKLDLWTKNAGLLKDLKETSEEDHFDSMDGQGMDNISEADNEY